MNSKQLINIAKGKLGLADDDYRDLLERVTGKRSLRDMTEKERLSVLDDLKSKGFQMQRKGGLSGKKYVRLIYSLWKSCARLGVIEDGSKTALRSFVAKKSETQGKRIDDPEFLTYDQASPIIRALKSMETRGKAAANG